MLIQCRWSYFMIVITVLFLNVSNWQKHQKKGSWVNSAFEICLKMQLFKGFYSHVFYKSEFAVYYNRHKKVNLNEEIHSSKT